MSVARESSLVMSLAPTGRVLYERAAAWYSLACRLASCLRHRGDAGLAPILDRLGGMLDSTCNVPSELAGAMLADLMGRYVDGDAGAFRELYARTSPRLRGYLRRLTRDGARADDLLQMTFLKVHRARTAYIRGADPIPWICAIAHRTFLDEVRRDRRSAARATEHDLTDLAVNLHGAIEAHDREHDPELGRRAVEALGTLPAKQREALVLTKLEGKSVAEAAKALGTTVLGIKARAHRGYVMLRELLAPAVAAGFDAHVDRAR